MGTTSSHGSDSPWIVSVRDLARGAGIQRLLNAEWPAPAGVATPLLGIPEGAPVELELRLESVHEGVLVTGTADAELEGECSRCLTPLREGITVDLQELYLTDPSVEDDGEQPLVERETVDLEPMFRDAVVPALPFRPLCRPDCQGLCPDCGIRLEDAPAGHAHERVDPRWAALAAFAGSEKTSTPETEER
ncbi:YceD family protein [Micrococcus sp.]|uniref:YceD family protein n=1 Tax=Micrococcus sp. TaxID=1271 RepID=UPI002A91674C|nr:YceD family protein [Micrococcus sp.]MDY6055659.1 YceD family protein [Micrococcus sp.]